MSHVTAFPLQCTLLVSNFELTVKLNSYLLSPIDSCAGCDKCWSSDVITFDQSWHHLCSSFTGGKDLSNDTQITVIDSMKKCRAKFPATSFIYSIVKIPCLDDAFPEIFELEARPVEGQSLPQKNKKKRKREGEKRNKKNQKAQKSI